MATVALRYLTEPQIADYRRGGYLAVPELIDRDRVKELRAVTEELVERSSCRRRGRADTPALPSPQPSPSPGRERE